MRLIASSDAIAAFERPCAIRREDVAFAFGEPFDRVAAAAGAQQLVADDRIDHAAAARDGPACGDELVELADAFLQQIADARGVIVEQIGGSARLDVLRQHEHRDVGML